MSNKIEKWLNVDVILQQKLKELEVLDKEREILIKKTEQTGEITPEVEKDLNDSLEKYIRLSNEVSALKKISKQMK